MNLTIRRRLLPRAPRLALLAALLAAPAAQGAVRVFLAPDGMQDRVEANGTIHLTLPAGQTFRLMAWIEDNAESGQAATAYQIIADWVAAPLKGSTGTLAYVDNNPGLGSGNSIFIDRKRADWLFAEEKVLDVPFYNETIGQYFGVIYQPLIDVAVDVSQRGILYLCEFELRASPDASGLFEYGFHLAPPPSTAILQAMGLPFVVDEFQRLSIEVVPQNIPIATEPPAGAIDARQPTDIAGGNPAGWDVLVWFYAAAAPQSTLDDFEVTLQGPGTPPGILAVVNNGTTQTIALDQPIPVGACTTIRHVPTGFAVSLGYLPGDVDGNGTSGPLDILTLIDGLNGVLDPPLEPWQCDLDRSGVCGPPDILRVIDLLNGAGAFDAWNGQSLPDCGG